MPVQTLEERSTETTFRRRRQLQSRGTALDVIFALSRERGRSTEIRTYDSNRSNKSFAALRRPRFDTDKRHPAHHDAHKAPHPQGINIVCEMLQHPQFVQFEYYLNSHFREKVDSAADGESVVGQREHKVQCPRGRDAGKVRVQWFLPGRETESDSLAVSCADGDLELTSLDASIWRSCLLSHCTGLSPATQEN